MTALADLSTLPPITQQRGGDPNLLKAELLDVISGAIDNHPRSLQKRIGPSEIGTPCTRRLGYKLAGTAEVNQRSTPWKPTVGTAVHAWLEETFAAANAGDDVARWLVEARVDVGDIAGTPIVGSCDLYDRVTATVIDWKIVGVSSLRDKKKHGPGETYRTQLHLYGRGYARRGLPVDTVALFALPQNGELSEGYWFAEPYDERIAVDALERASRVQSIVDTLGPAGIGALPTADAFCTYCPFFRADSTDLAGGCPGHAGSTAVLAAAAPATLTDALR